MPPHKPDYAKARERGRRDAATLVSKNAPADNLERVAWASGFSEGDELQAAIGAARAAGLTWREIGEAAGVPMRTIISRYERARKRSGQ